MVDEGLDACWGACAGLAETRHKDTPSIRRDALGLGRRGRDKILNSTQVPMVNDSIEGKRNEIGCRDRWIFAVKNSLVVGEGGTITVPLFQGCSANFANFIFEDSRFGNGWGAGIWAGPSIPSS